MVGWERINKTSLPTKKRFYSNLTIECIADSDYKQAKRVWEDFQLQNQYIQSDNLLLADIFENFGNKCFEIYELDFALFLSASKLAW